MALNLWKIGGKPTSYNPLPTGWVNFVPIGKVGDYRITFVASSPTNTKLSVTSNLRTYIGVDIVLTSVPTKYTFDIKGQSDSSGTIYFYDFSSKGDIIIDSIELVQKPLPKLTINGIDGFKSGKWTLHANAVVVDDETLVHNATALGQSSYFLANVTPNANYVYQVDSDSSIGVYVDGSTPIVSYTKTKSISFNSGNNTSLRFYIRADALGQFTFKRPMLNLGSIPAPYEAKRGDKMVMPVAKKNLCSVVSASLTTATVSSLITIPVKPNTSYTVNSFVDNANGSGTARIRADRLDSGKTNIAFGASNLLNAGQSGYSSETFVTPYNCYYLLINAQTGGGFTGVVNFSQIQLEEGTTATAYTPYAVQVNPKPKKWVPKKNLIFNPEILFSANNTGTGTVAKMTDETIPYWRITASAGNISTYATPMDTSFYTPVDGKVYTISCEVRIPASGSVAFYSTRGSNANIPANTWTKISYTFTYTSNPVYRILGHTYGGSQLDYRNFQIEEGSTQTVYEPYTLVLPKAKTGLSFNGATDYILTNAHKRLRKIDFSCDFIRTMKIGSSYNMLWAINSQGIYIAIDQTDFLFLSVIDSNNAQQTIRMTDFVIPVNPSKVNSLHLVYDGTSVTVTLNGVTKTYSFNKGLALLGLDDSAYKSIIGMLNNTNASYQFGGIMLSMKLNDIFNYDFTNSRLIAGNTVIPSAIGQTGKNKVPTDVSAWEQGSWASNGVGNPVTNSQITTRIRVKVPFEITAGKTYTYKVFDGFECYLWFVTSGGIVTGSVGWANQLSAVVPANTIEAFALIRKADGSNIGTNDLALAKPQLEEGSVATAWEPYIWQEVSNKEGNLIPNFDDPRWSIHANAKVLGRDFLHLDSTGTGQYSYIILDVLPNTNYLKLITGQAGTNYTITDSANSVVIATGQSIFNTGSYTKIRINIGNSLNGSFDFVRPQLYKLTGKEGTIYGNPVKLRRSAQRLLYAKR